eukprot:TRINITY_DN837_c0_g1_i1.p1 TRINITY_DN837_c0_g1~~TRINITY_DN837_c0_g1_i1.p1  ORF type:complete len:129 (-),score=30.92 TRINITY_DN837_c0_g1_i1:395-781(-)
MNRLVHHRVQRLARHLCTTPASTTLEPPKQAYLIYRANVRDFDTYKSEYMTLSKPALERFGGKFLVRGGAKETLEATGPFVEETARVIVALFPSMQHARAFYNSPQYKEAVAKRQPVSDVQLVIVEAA